MTGGLLSLKWNNHQSTFLQVLSSLCLNDTLSDVTLACEGEFYAAHKLVLSVCSEYFEKIFERIDGKHPVIVLKDINSEELEALLNYMYEGEVNVVQDKLAGLIKAAEYLKIKGLSETEESPQAFSKIKSKILQPDKISSEEISLSPPAKRKRPNSETSDTPSLIDAPLEERNDNPPNTTFADQANHFLYSTQEKIDNEAQQSLSFNDPKQQFVIPAKFDPMKEEANSEISCFKEEIPDIDDELDKECSMDAAESIMHPLPFEFKDVNVSCASEEIDDVYFSEDGKTRLRRAGEHIVITPDDVTSMLSGHEDENNIGNSFSCTYCIFETTNKIEFDAHQLQHQTEKTFFCNFCSYSCSTKSNLKCHVRRHTGEKPYGCPHCDYRSAQSSNIKIHVKRMHKNSPAKMSPKEHDTM